MPTITITYESDMFGVMLDSLVAYAVASGEAIDVKPAANAPAKARGNYGDGVPSGGGYGGRRGADTAQAAPTPNFGEKVCAECGLNTHSVNYKRCYECAQALSAEYVDCAECNGANRHKRNYPRCYQCAQARKAYESAPDEDYAGNGG